MKSNSRICQSLLFAVAPCIAIALSSPAKAASLAFSGAQTALRGQLSSPTSTEFFTSTIDSNSLVLGNGTDFQALAQQSIRVENLFLAADQTSPIRFSFDFSALLRLNTAVDTPNLELARAKGAISLALYDVTNGLDALLDSVSINLLGSLNTPGSGDSLKLSSTGNNLALLPSLTTRNFGGLQESASAQVRGTYDRTFYHPTSLKIVQRIDTKACVQAPKQLNFCGRAVPEPSYTSAILVFLASTGGIGWLRSRKAKPVILKQQTGIPTAK